ncbi:hypothetical protein ZWY2020_022855 [Hordeum vulgare]|nr:hypothetical protein ZWY2020_022855 [Hordeum vulgare]
MGDRPRPAAYTNSSGHTRVANGQQEYYKSEEGAIAAGGGTVYSSEYARVAGGQQGYHKSARKIEEGMSAMTLGSAGGSASGERSERHDATYYSKMEKQHGRRETLGHLGAMAAAAFAMHEKHKAKKVDPEDAEAHIIKEAMATAVATSSADWAIHEFRRKKEAQSHKSSVVE